MKKNIVPLSGALLGAVLWCMLSGFSYMPGAHSVQVYLDSKLIIDHHVDSRTAAPAMTLSESSKQLIVKYSECGRTVTGRKITIRDKDNVVLKEWQFTGSSKGFEEPMVCPVKDILALKQKNNSPLKVFYSSADFPEGQQIVSLTVEGATTAAR